MAATVENAKTRSGSGRLSSSPSQLNQSSNSVLSAGSASSAPRTYWKPQLLLLQESAPKPIVVPAEHNVPNHPDYYGAELHGLIDREHADQLLAAAGEGAYLVRESQRIPGTHTLCLRFDGHTKNYRLYYDGQHYVGEKRFESVEQCVADGLICMYLDKHASDYIKRMTEECNYEEAPYSQYQRRALNQNKRVNNAAGGAVTNSTSSGVSSGTLISNTTGSSYNNPLSVNGAAASPLSTAAQQVPPHSLGTSRPQSQIDVSIGPLKAHRFKQHTFKAHFCDYCGNFMWGLVQQGLRCEDCGFAAHKKCSEKTRMDCQPDLKYVKRMFAVDLSTLCMAHQTVVPPVVSKCIIEVESRGLFAEGIYRISGSFEEIERLRSSFDLAAKPVDLSPAKVDDIHSVAGLLKLYFRLLPQPLVTFSCYGQMINVMRQQSRNDYERVKGMRRVLEGLPVAHLDTLRLLINHLSVVSEHAAVNKMTVENLSTIFAPTILCGQGAQNMSMALPQQETYVMQYLIINARKLFPNTIAVPSMTNQHSSTQQSASNSPPVNTHKSS